MHVQNVIITIPGRELVNRHVYIKKKKGCNNGAVESNISNTRIAVKARSEVGNMVARRLCKNGRGGAINSDRVLRYSRQHNGIEAGGQVWHVVSECALRTGAV